MPALEAALPLKSALKSPTKTTSKGVNEITPFVNTEPVALNRSPYHIHIAKPIYDRYERSIKTAFQGRKERNENKLKSEKM